MCDYEVKNKNTKITKIIFSKILQAIYQTLSIWLGTQFSQPNPELGPLQAVF